jgi:hypothetical protein
MKGLLVESLEKNDIKKRTEIISNNEYYPSALVFRTPLLSGAGARKYTISNN